MAITRLHLMGVHFKQSQYDNVIDTLVKHDVFHLVSAHHFSENVAGLTTLNRENIYEEFVQFIENRCLRYQLELQKGKVDIHEFNVIKKKQDIEEIFNKMEEIYSVKAQLEEMIKENQEAIIHLHHIKGLDIDFDDLFSCKYLQVRFGKIPKKFIKKIEYYETMPFLFETFDIDQDMVWGMYVTTPEHAPEIDNIFSALFFQRVYIPPFVHGEVDLAIGEVEQEIQVAMNLVLELNQRISRLYIEHQFLIHDTYATVEHLNQVSVMQRYIVVMNDTLSIYGFVPKKASKALKAKLIEIKDVFVDITPATSDHRLKAPTMLKSNIFTKPFSLFVEMYGVPSYHDIDPTVFVAFSYTLLFGIMFGDIGQGLLLSLLGYFASKKFGLALGDVGVRLGLSSAFFGIIYGSIFGNEHIITPIFHVMDSKNTMTLLILAVSLGIILLITSILFSIVIHYRSKNYGELYFSQNGISGLIFYVSVLAFVALPFIGINIPSIPYVPIFIVLPILCVFLKEPLTHRLENKAMFPDGIGGFLMEGVFELFEVLLSFITNTLSFLRVGGFVLSHAGMMLVVYTLAEMFTGVGYYLVIIFGNLFVMGLEGLIVGIQVLRLEFYEMFSRYYKGDGVLFSNISEKIKN